eukprot:COSAG06_NODE_6424_length_2938_cov_4.027827_4_plen_80_part_00
MTPPFMQGYNSQMVLQPEMRLGNFLPQNIVPSNANTMYHRKRQETFTLNLTIAPLQLPHCNWKSRLFAKTSSGQRQRKS